MNTPFPQSVEELISSLPKDSSGRAQPCVFQNQLNNKIYRVGTNAGFFYLREVGLQGNLIKPYHYKATIQEVYKSLERLLVTV
jgi:hypothetical protein